MPASTTSAPELTQEQVQAILVQPRTMVGSTGGRSRAGRAQPVPAAAL
jgi:hypothetical protein